MSSHFYNITVSTHHTIFIRFNANHRFRTDCVTGWNQTWKNDTSLPWREGRGIGWCFVESPKLYAPQYCMNGWMTAVWVVLGIRWLEAAWEQLLSTTLAWVLNQHQVAHACHGYVLKHCSCAKPNGVASIGVNCEYIRTWKVESEHHNKQQHKTLVGGSTLKEKNSNSGGSI